MLQTERRLYSGYRRELAFVIGRPYNITVGHTGFLCGLCKLLADEGIWFVHEQLEDSTEWKLKEA